jgi:hypothetical protein
MSIDVSRALETDYLLHPRAFVHAEVLLVIGDH